MLLVFSSEKSKKKNSQVLSASNEIELNENWQVEFFPVEGESFKKEIQSLKNLTDIAGLETFGGTIIYSKSVKASNKKTLKMGKVAETAEVTLNGNNLGVKWWGEKTFDISNALKDGKNKLEIKGTTLLWNYCNSLTMEEYPMAKLWANNNRNKKNKPLPAGLIGPVAVSYANIAAVELLSKLFI